MNCGSAASVIVLFVARHLFRVGFTASAATHFTTQSPNNHIGNHATHAYLGLTPEWGWRLGVTLVSLLILQLGYIWFMKSKRVFADVI